jgi:hypothetical protein
VFECGGSVVAWVSKFTTPSTTIPAHSGTEMPTKTKATKSKTEPSSTPGSRASSSDRKARSLSPAVPTPTLSHASSLSSLVQPDSSTASPKSRRKKKTAKAAVVSQPVPLSETNLNVLEPEVDSKTLVASALPVSTGDLEGTGQERRDSE